MAAMLATDSAWPISRLGRFAWLTAVGVAFACISATLVWSATDASFRMGVWKAKACLRLERVQTRDGAESDPEGICDRIRSWDWTPTGRRAAVFAALGGIGLLSTVACIALMYQRPTSRRFVTVCLILAAWSLLYGTHRSVDSWRARRQIAAVFPAVEEMGLALSGTWPDRPGKTPSGISFYVDVNRYPNVLLLTERRPRSPFRETFGQLITRGSDGAIRFDLAGAADSSVEFHPNGTVPAEHLTAFGYGSVTPVEVSRLKENWYLVRYGTP